MNSKNIIFHVTKKYMKLNRRRTAITFIGIVFMVMLMTCVFAGKATVMKYLQKVAALDKGSWHMIVYDLTPEQAENVRSLDEVETAGLSEQLGVIEFPQSGDKEYKPFLNVKAYSPESFQMTNITLKEGRLPENANEIIISDSAIADGSSVKLGDTISGEYFTRSITSKKSGDGFTSFPFFNVELPYGGTVEVSNDFLPYFENEDYTENRIMSGRTGEYTVVGIMNAPGFEKTSGACYSALCGMDELAASDKVNMMLTFDLDKIDFIYEFREDLKRMIGGDVIGETNELVLTFAEKGSDSSINGLTIFVEIFFTVLIMAASVVLIYNVFNMSFAERTKYLGMLSSVGATGRQKRQSIYYECFALLIPALPVGILAGLGVITGGMKLIKPNLDKLIGVLKYGVKTDIPVSLKLGLTELCLIIGMCVVTVMISALIPAIKISKIGPVESIRGNTEKSKKKKKRYATRKSLLEKGKPEMLLAVNGTTRSKHLTRSIVRSVAAFAVLVMVTLYGAKSVIALLDIMTGESGWDYVPEDYSYYLAYNKDDEQTEKLINDVLENSAVTKKKEIDYTSVRISADSLSGEFMDAYKEMFFRYADNTEADWEEHIERELGRTFGINVIAVDDEEFAYLAKNGDADMSIAENPDEPSVLVYENTTLSTDYYGLGNDLIGYRCIEVNNSFSSQKGGELLVDNGSLKPEYLVNFSIKVAGTVNKDTIAERFKIFADTPYIFVNRSALKLINENNGDHTLATVLFRADNDANGAFIKQLSDLCEQSVNTGSEFVMGDYADRNQGMNIKQVIAAIIKILAYCFTALISAVCLLNLYNSIRGRAAERTRETAVLRSVGMTDKQLTKMRDLENLMLLGRGLCAAAVICAGLIFVMYRAMTGYFGRVELPVPWVLSIGIAAAICAASSIITRICGSSADKSDIIEKIRRETV
ncbi:MAG: FtsX-like permease family protein [Ruminococcus sp.]|nr:FtsX-like permease family protein [Ruminococcus sp.]